MRYILEHSEFKKERIFKPGEWVWITFENNNDVIKNPGKIIKMRSPRYKIQQNMWYDTEIFYEENGKWQKSVTKAVIISPMTEEEIEDFKIKLQASKYNL